jgi:probable F420-dependent oxidoreductase
MKFGIMFANVGPYVEPDMAAAFGRIAEEHGIESLWAVEHVVVPSDYQSQYPYSSSGRMPGPEESPIPDPLIWLTWVGAATTTLRLATGILILPQRNPVILAKELATLDVLSKGRVVLGVGVGWLREEFDALGVPFEGRGARTDEYIEALRTLWRDEEPCFEGQYARFDRAKCYPKPPQGTIPIHVGGHTPAAARRAGRLGDGFFPGRSTDDDLVPLLDAMRASAKDAGRDPDAIEVTAGGVMDLDGVRRFADYGVDRIVLPPLGFDLDTLREQLGRFSEQVIEKVG